MSTVTSSSSRRRRHRRASSGVNQRAPDVGDRQRTRRFEESPSCEKSDAPRTPSYTMRCLASTRPSAVRRRTATRCCDLFPRPERKAPTIADVVVPDASVVRKHQPLKCGRPRTRPTNPRRCTGHGFPRRTRPPTPPGGTADKALVVTQQVLLVVGVVQKDNMYNNSFPPSILPRLVSSRLACRRSPYLREENQRSTVATKAGSSAKKKGRNDGAGVLALVWKPWRCLCFGFFLQYTYKRFFRRTMMQWSHILRTADLTFIGNERRNGLAPSQHFAKGGEGSGR
mmetsp:Transcript_18744/g.60539  ORF Transcript_18744/g.60539 Transcript_18744/m.60539 type:complete len:284 (-) Transcript_18744:25-876(-)